MTPAASVNTVILVKTMLTVVVGMARGAGMVFFLPVLAGHPVGSRFLKAAITLAFSVPVIFASYGKYDFVNVGAGFFTLLLSKEFFIGLCISFSAAIPFWAIEIAGFLLDTMRGASMAEIFNIMLKTQTSLFGVLFSLIINVLFFSVGGLNILLEQFYLSYTVLPIVPITLHLSQAWISFFSTDIKVIFSLALVFCLPAILIMLINDIVLGLINVSARELNVFNLSMPIKSVLVLFMIIITINYSIPNYIRHFYMQAAYINKVVRGLQ